MEENYNMENTSTNKKKLYIGIALFMVILIIGGSVFLFLHKQVSFEENDKLYFKMFANTYEQDEYEFYSLDAYYLEDTQMYYYNAKFKGYSSIDDTWYDVDEVAYGRIQKFFNSYCLSWDELYGFEEENKEFERAQKEGIHKTYTKDEIKEFLDKAYKEKEADNK